MQAAAFAAASNPVAAAHLAANQAALAAAEAEKRANLLALHGGNIEKANMDDRLYQNIQESNTFKQLFECRTFEEIIDKGEESIKYINAWGDQVHPNYLVRFPMRHAQRKCQQELLAAFSSVGEHIDVIANARWWC